MKQEESVRFVNCPLLGLNAVGKRPSHCEVSTFRITLLIWSTFSTYLGSPKWKLRASNSKCREPNSARKQLPPFQLGLHALPLWMKNPNHKFQIFVEKTLQMWTTKIPFHWKRTSCVWYVLRLTVECGIPVFVLKAGSRRSASSLALHSINIFGKPLLQLKV
jgi:hypothetical protein